MSWSIPTATGEVSSLPPRGGRFNGNGRNRGIQAWAVQIRYVRSKNVQMLEILIVLVIALIVFGPMLLKARKHTDD